MDNFVKRSFSSIFIFLYIILVCFSDISYVLIFIMLILSIYELYSITHKEGVFFNSYEDIKRNFIFISYGSFISLSLYIAYIQQEMLFTIFMITILHDVGGYVFGNIFKGPKLLPSISPSKTWSGFIGGILLGTIFSFVYAKIPLINIIIANFVGILGDLTESKIKRLFKIKDSGNIIPGHGGILDRFDSFFFINIFFYFSSKF